jgi:hypothetical protein
LAAVQERVKLLLKYLLELAEVLAVLGNELAVFGQSLGRVLPHVHREYLG